MKWNCKQSELLRIVQNSLEFVQQRSVQSIYGNIFFKLSKNMLEIKATSISSGFEGRIPVQGDGDGMITVQGELFTQMIRNLKEEEMLEFRTDDEFLYISSALSTVNYKIRYVAADSFEYREMPDTEDSICVSKSIFFDMASKAIVSVSDDESKPNLCGVYAEFKSDSISLTSSDGRCLTYYKKDLDFPNIEEDKSMIIPSKFIRDLLKIAPDGDTFTIKFSDSAIYAVFKDCTVWTVLTKAVYPSVATILGRDYANTVVFSVDAFSKLLRHVCIMSDDKSRRISMNFTSGKLVVTSLDKEEIGTGSEEISCDYDGEDVSFAVCYTYLQNQLKILTTDSFFFSFSQEKAPVKIEPSPNKEYSAIIMTMSADK